MQDIYSEANSDANDPNIFGAYRLMTAEIVFTESAGSDFAITWQDYDVTPGFPRLRAFIAHWSDDPARRIRSVTVTEIAAALMPACRISPTTAAVH
ncbi:MAG: hypothetical protein RLT05_12385 [Bauldia litoralis]